MSDLEYPWETPPETGTVTEVAPGIRWLRMPMPGSLSHINLYLLRDGDGWAVVDTGLGDEATRDAWHIIWRDCLDGRPIRRVICTHMHPDHVGQAGEIGEHWRAPLFMTQMEYFNARAFSASSPSRMFGWEVMDHFRAAGVAPEVLEGMQRRMTEGGGFGSMITPFPTTFHRLRQGDVLTLAGTDWQVLVGSGHSPEHACLYSRALGILLSGDQVLPVITSNVSVSPVQTTANPLKDWLESHDRFLALPDETLVLPAHNLPFRGLRKRLRALIAHHEDRMLAIEEHCTAPATAFELLPILFQRTLDERQVFMALGEAIAHVHLLLHRDRLERHMAEDGAWRYRSIDPDLARRRREEHDAPDDSPMEV